MKIEHFQLEDALLVIKEVAKDLKKRKIPLWDDTKMTVDSLFKDLPIESIATGYIDTKPIAAMILTTYDPLFWPDIPKGQSGFIHKLCVLPKYQGKGISQLMLRYAENYFIDRKINTLRLDCAGDRPKLCSFYEQYGFKKVDERMVSKYFTAFYLKKLYES